jgi:hypothetical protein
MSIPTTIHIGEEPYYGGMHRITNYALCHDRDKPAGGLWCSTLDIEYGTDWLRHCELNMGGAWSWHGNHEHISPENAMRHKGKEHHAYHIIPSEDARILHLEDEEDYEIVKELYPLAGRTMLSYGVEITGVDWEAVAQDYDVVYVHKEACVRSWDCDTVLFCNFKWECVGIHEYAEKVRERRCDV